jgi:Fungal Zn(2)-Cys(6) binuclear cluster domain
MLFLRGLGRRKRAEISRAIRISSSSLRRTSNVSDPIFTYFPPTLFAHIMESESAAKRRKLRRGTRSCWECKRRKLRCLFEHDSPTETTSCLNCRRRGTKCVSQEFPEEISAPLDKVHQMRDRVVRITDQLEQLIKKVGENEKGVRGRVAGGDEEPSRSEAREGVANSASSPSLTLQVSLEVRVRGLSNPP